MGPVVYLRQRRELRREMKRANPRGLSAKCYRIELDRQKAAERKLEVAKSLPPQDFNLSYARQIAPHLIPSPPMTREQQAEQIRQALIARANGY